MKNNKQHFIISYFSFLLLFLNPEFFRLAFANSSAAPCKAPPKIMQLDPDVVVDERLRSQYLSETHVFIDRGPNFEFINAVSSNSLPAIDSALNHGADIQYLTDKNSSFLHLFITDLRVNLTTLEYLIFAGVPLQQQNFGGQTALHLLVLLRQAPMQALLERSKLLLQSGLNPNIKNNAGQTALILAATFNMPEWADNLIAFSANVDEQNNEGASALMWASSEGFISMVELLLAHNANITLQPKVGFSALESSILYRHTEITALLRKALNLQNESSLSTLTTKTASLIQSIVMQPYFWLLAASSLIIQLGLSYYQHQQQLKSRHIFNETTYKQSLIARNKHQLECLNFIIKVFYPEWSWRAINPLGTFTLNYTEATLSLRHFAMHLHEQHFQCSLSRNEFFSILFTQLAKINQAPLHTSDDAHMIVCHFPNSSSVTIDRDATIRGIKAQLYASCIQSPAYQSCDLLYQHALILNENHHIQLPLTYLRTLLPAFVSISQIYSNQFANLQMGMSASDLSNNKRTAQPFKDLQKALQIPISIQEIHECQNVFNTLTFRLSQTNLTMLDLQAIKSTQASLLAKIQNLTINPIHWQANLEFLLTAFKQSLTLYQQDKLKVSKQLSDVKLELEKKHQQREEKQRLELEAEQRAREIAKQRTQQYRDKIKEERRLLQEQRRIESERAERQLLADQKRKEDEARLQATSSSTSSTSSTIQPRQVQDKILRMGDILQRYDSENNPCEALQIQCKYALLAECLRLFELTSNLVKSRIARDIRNVLMHRHCYLDLQAIYELAISIAHKPNEPVKILKFENIVNSITTMTIELENQLKFSLVSLSVSKFVEKYVKVTYEPATIKTHLEILMFLFRDLVKLHSKIELDLNFAPDRVLAIQGIIMCCGECLQQIRQKQSINLSLRLFPHPDLFVAFTHFATRIRENMAHRSHDVQEELVHYQYYLNKATALLEHVQAIYEFPPIQDALNQTDNRHRLTL